MNEWIGKIALVAGALILLHPVDTLGQGETLTGTWGGLRPALADRGISLEAVYTADVFTDVSGGRRRETVYLDNIDLILTADAEILADWPGATLFIYGLGNHGENPSLNVGDAQGVSSIAAPSTWKLYEAWIQQNLLQDRLSMLAGLYDLNSEFDAMDAANLFLNSSHGIDVTFSQSGENGPSIFPVTALGVRVKWAPVPAVYLMTVALDGVAGDPGNPRGTQVILKESDGLLSTTEVGYLFAPESKSSSHPGERHRLGRFEAADYAGKVALGVWFYTSRFEKVGNASGPGRDFSRGAYLIAEHLVYAEHEDPGQGLTVFGRLGWADPEVNRFEFYLGGGLVYTGLIPGREEDGIGLAFAAAFNGKDFERARSAMGEAVTDA